MTFLFLMLCPLFFRSCTVEASNVPRFLLVVIFCFTFFIKWISQRRVIYLPPVYLFTLLGGYYLLNILSVCWSLNSADAIYESQKIFLVPCLLVIFLNWLQTKEEDYLLVKSLIAITFIYCIYAFVEIVHLPDFKFESLYGVNSFAEHKNLLASFLFLLLAFPLYGLIYFKTLWRFVSGFVLILNFLLLLFLQTRSVYLALTFTGLIFFICSWKVKFDRRKLISGLAAFVILFGLLFVFYPTLLQRFNVFSYSTSASGNERLKIWSKTFYLIKENTLQGVGAGNWQYNFSKFGIGDIINISQNEISFQRPHNDLLWIISESGLIGFAFIILIIIFVFAKSYPAIKSGNYKGLIFFSFLSGLLVESFFSFPKERITHIVLASVMFALLIKNLDLTIKLPQKSSAKLLVIVLLILTFSSVIGLYRLKGEYFTVLLLQEKEKNNMEGVIGNGTKAISVFYKCDPTSTPIYSYMGWAYNALHEKDSLLYVSKEAYNLSPYDYEVLSNYGSALERTGNREEAREILKECLRINPLYEPALINSAVLEYNSRNYRQAIDYLKLILDYEIKYKTYFDEINSKLQSN